MLLDLVLVFLVFGLLKTEQKTLSEVFVEEIAYFYILFLQSPRQKLQLLVSLSLKRSTCSLRHTTKIMLISISVDLCDNQKPLGSFGLFFPESHLMWFLCKQPTG